MLNEQDDVIDLHTNYFRRHMGSITACMSPFYSLYRIIIHLHSNSKIGVLRLFLQLIFYQ